MKEKEVAKFNSNNVILRKGEERKFALLILKGTVIVKGDYMQRILKAGSIIGILEGTSGQYFYDYIAKDEVSVFPVDVGDLVDMKKLLRVNQDGTKLVMSSMKKQLQWLIQVEAGLSSQLNKVTEMLDTMYETYKSLCKSYFVQPIFLEQLSEISPLASELDYSSLLYVTEWAKIPLEVFYSYLNSSEEVAYYHIQLGVKLAKELHVSCASKVKRLMQYASLLFDAGEENLFSIYSVLGLKVQAAKGNVEEVLKELEEITEFLGQLKAFMMESLYIPFSIDKTRMNDIYLALKQTDEQENHGTLLLQFNNEQVDKAVAELTDMTKTILSYANMDAEKAAEFENNLTAYRSLKDPFSSEDMVRKLRGKITQEFYEIYERVFFRAEEEKCHDKVIDLFLNFGLMDEKMVERDTLVKLYYLDMNYQDDILQIFTMRSWLRAIFTGKRQPSKNEFDLDYKENLREMKKTTKMSEEEERAYLNDAKGKVHFEIMNMFKSNHKITNGQISTFVPFVKEQDFFGNVEKCFASKEAIKEALLHVLSIDFSAFHREYLYRDTEHNIEKIFIMKQVLPDIILTPTVGQKGSMWQEISERKRDTPARFIFPIFATQDMKQLMIEATGAFRWEMCRTMQGTYWNDVREKSLTSEYCDYVQFYKKNKELSDTVKEKIKLQLQKCRNNYREMFVQDYALWVQNEVHGSVRLNKVARMILFTYCPFTKAYRVKLASQPMFQEAAAKYEREQLKKVKDVMNRYAAIRNNHGEITDVLEENLHFYQDM